MYESQVVDHKMDIERLSRELQEVKKKYYLQKKKEQLTRWVEKYLINDMYLDCMINCGCIIFVEKERESLLKV